MYQIGTNRLWYAPVANTGATVTLDVLSPDLVRSNQMPMIALDDLYYADIGFNQPGSHFIRVFENGEKKHQSILVVDDTSGLVIYPD